MKIKNKKLVEILNSSNYNYYGFNNADDFVANRILSVYINKNITITLDCSIDMDEVGNIMQAILDYALEQGIDFMDIAVKFA